MRTETIKHHIRETIEYMEREINRLELGEINPIFSSLGFRITLNQRIDALHAVLDILEENEQQQYEPYFGKIDLNKAPD